MRGKHGVAAEKRRTVAELEERASSAERRAAKAEAALAELKEKSERQINGLRGELAQAIKDREVVSAPSLDAAQKQTRELARDLVGVRMKLARFQKAKVAYEETSLGHLAALLTEAGIPEPKLTAIVDAFVDRLHMTVAGDKQQLMAELRRERGRLTPGRFGDVVPEAV